MLFGRVINVFVKEMVDLLVQYFVSQSFLSFSAFLNETRCVRRNQMKSGVGGFDAYWLCRIATVHLLTLFRRFCASYDSNQLALLVKDWKVA